MKKYLENLKSLFAMAINMYLIFFGLGWIIVHLYFRVIIERSSFYFQDIKNTVTNYHFILFSFFVIIHFILIILNLIEILRKKDKQPKLPESILRIFKVFSDIIHYIYWKPLEKIHDIISPIIPGSARFFVYLTKQGQKIYRIDYYFYGLIIIFDIMPKMIIAISFFVDIAIYGQIKYFLYCIGLVFIPIFFSIFLKLFLTCSVKNFPVIKEYFENIEGVDPIYNDSGHVVSYRRYNYLVKEEYLSVIDANEEFQLLLTLDYMRKYSLQLKEYLLKTGPYITLITSSLYCYAGIIRFVLCFL